MKKLLALLLALTMVFAFAACGDKSDADDKNDKTEENGNNNNDNNDKDEDKDEDKDDDKDDNNNDSNSNVKFTADDVAGEWELVINVTDLFDMALENPELFSDSDISEFAVLNSTDFKSDAKMIVDISFEKDGSCSIVADTDKFLDFYSDFFDDFFTYAEDGGFEKMLDAAGQDMNELMEMLEEQGISLDEYLEYMREDIEEEIDSMKEFSEESMVEIPGEWEVNNDTIIVIGDDEADNTNFKITDYDGDTITCIMSTEDNDMEMELEVTLERK